LFQSTPRGKIGPVFPIPQRMPISSGFLARLDTFGSKVRQFVVAGSFRARLLLAQLGLGILVLNGAKILR
jgi:hypothetical protein